VILSKFWVVYIITFENEVITMLIWLWQGATYTCTLFNCFHKLTKKQWVHYHKERASFFSFGQYTTYLLRVNRVYYNFLIFNYVIYYVNLNGYNWVLNRCLYCSPFYHYLLEYSSDRTNMFLVWTVREPRGLPKFSHVS